MDDHVGGDKGLIGMEEFFETLPSEEFLAVEEDLREIIINYLAQWKQRNPPRTRVLEADPEIKRLVDELLQGSAATLGEWCKRRIGGEIDVQGSGVDETLALVPDGGDRGGEQKNGRKRRRRG